MNASIRQRDLLPRVGTQVVLRRLSPADLPTFQAYRQDEAVGRYQGWTPQPDHEALAFLEQMGDAVLFTPGEWVQLAIADRNTGSLIGDLGLCVAVDGETAEIGFTLQPQAQGRGFATEAVGEAIQLLFEHTAVTEVIGITDERNAASIRLLERVGMRRVGAESTVFRGEPCIEIVYAVFREEGG